MCPHLHREAELQAELGSKSARLLELEGSQERGGSQLTPFPEEKVAWEVERGTFIGQLKLLRSKELDPNDAADVEERVRELTQELLNMQVLSFQMLVTDMCTTGAPYRRKTSRQGSICHGTRRTCLQSLHGEFSKYCLAAMRPCVSLQAMWQIT